MRTPDRRRGEFSPPNVPLSTASQPALSHQDGISSSGRTSVSHKRGRKRFPFHIELGEIAHIHKETSSNHAPLGKANGDGNAAFYRLHEMQEEAARRVAQRLHDDAGQMLATVYIELAKIHRDCSAATAVKINGVVKLLDEVCEQIRSLSHELRPPILDQLGLIPALQSLAKGFSKRSGLKVVVSQDPVEIPPAIQIVLYRVVQEALTNVVRHAWATKAEVRLWVEQDKVHCRIKDNGIGFSMPNDGSAAAPGLGLVGIYERVSALGGDCHIVSCRRRGTQFMELQVEIPL